MSGTAEYATLSIALLYHACSVQGRCCCCWKAATAAKRIRNKNGTSCSSLTHSLHAVSLSLSLLSKPPPPLPEPPRKALQPFQAVAWEGGRGREREVVANGLSGGGTPLGTLPPPKDFLPPPPPKSKAVPMWRREGDTFSTLGDVDSTCRKEIYYRDISLIVGSKVLCDLF